MSRLIVTNIVNPIRIKNIINSFAKTITTASLPIERTEEKSDQLFTKVVKKKPSKKPFMKNIFLGNFDTDILGFPEVLNNEEYAELNRRLANIDSYVTLINKKDLIKNEMPYDVIENLKNLQLFGLQSPRFVNGLELNETENCRVLESLAQNSSLALSIIMHQYFGVKSVLKHCKTNVRDDYLNYLSSGSSLCAFCLLEQDTLDPNQMKTTAELCEDGKHYVLNGTKTWVVNGGQSDTYMVLAKTNFTQNTNPENDTLSLFLVEKEFGDITTQPCHPSGLKGADICNVRFNNTIVPADNLLGEGGDSVKIITSLLQGLRLSSGPLSIGLLRKLLDKFSKCALDSTPLNENNDAHLMSEKMAKLNMSLYAIESMTYMTAGLTDCYENHDCELESAIVKVFSTEQSLKSIETCLLLSGAPAFMQDYWLNNLFNDALGLTLINETNESLRIIIALLGLQYAGSGLSNVVKQHRNPLYFPKFIVKKLFEQRRQHLDNPKLDMHLEEFLHPSLIHSARWLEYCVYRMQYATETMLIRHGPNVIQQHMELRRLADVAINIYAMVSVLSRASRSYCIGLQNANYELLLANSFCLNAKELVKRLVIEIVNGPYGTNDVNYQKIASKALEWKGYFAEHPLKKNF